MNSEQFQESTGWRGVFHCLPATRNFAQKAIMPLGYFYSPFLAEPAASYHSPPALCSKCKASISNLSARNRQSKMWTCSFCGGVGPYMSEIGAHPVQEFVEGKVGDNGLFFIVDLCMSEGEFNSVKATMIKAINNMPNNIFIGLLAFNKNLFLQDFLCATLRFTCISGSQDLGANNFTKLKDILNLLPANDPRHIMKVVTSRYFVPINQGNRQKLIAGIQSLEADTHFVKRQERQKRASGCAIQAAIGLVSEIGINVRFVSIISGPCTIGHGKVVNLPLKSTIRSYIDIFQGNENTEHLKSATAFYQTLAAILVKNHHTFDIWAYGLDQFGLLEMKGMVNETGGLLAMHELFDHFIFQSSFQKFYEQNQNGTFNFPVAATLSLRVSKELRINGIIGTCKSLKDNSLKIAAEMEIGEGLTHNWYIGGISMNSALCIIVSLSDLIASQNKERSALIQAVTTYKYSDNILRHKVSTLSLDFVKENQQIEMIKKFDEQAAIVMLARLSAKKAEIQDSIEVKKWVDRILLKFTVKFAQYNRHDKSSFRLPSPMKHFPQFIYHLRRSNFINPFGAPPDQSIYTKTCLLRESISNCVVMIQPALLKYKAGEEPVPVELDFQQLKEDVILLLDSYFNVLVWNGEHIQGWKEQNIQEDPQYAYLAEFFAMPLQDASQIMYDRIPSSNFYETWKNDGKERYLKSRVNPSKSNKDEGDGHFVSDDAPIKMFMEFLVRSVINYNE